MSLLFTVIAIIVIDLTAVFTSDDDEPGARSVTLYANWLKVGARGIGIFAGKATNINPWYKVNVKECMTMATVSLSAKILHNLLHCVLYNVRVYM